MGKASKSNRKASKAPRAKDEQNSDQEVEREECFLCQQPSDGKRCPHCGIAQYCTEEHLKLHRPEKLCFPFKVERKDGVGRFLVATRDIQPMELILYDRTLAYGPKPQVPVVCLQCLKPTEGKKQYRCTSCGWPLCDEKCQNGKVHQMECTVLSKCRRKLEFSTSTSESNPAYRAIAPLRLLLLREARPEFHARFEWLMDHNEERRADRETWEHHRETVNKFIREDCGASFTDEEIDRAVGIYWTNAFSFSGGVGQAVFPTFSFVSHSCVSNANHVVFPNRHLALQAKVLIRKGEELTISYISPIQSTLRRQSKLRDKWFFLCRCGRCSDPTEKSSHVSSLLCQAKCHGVKCGGVMSLADPFAEEGDKFWACSSCTNRLEAQDVLNLENDIARELQSLAGNDKSGQLARFRQLYGEFRVFLHRNHYLLMLLKRHIIVLSSHDIAKYDQEQVTEIKKMCEEVLDVLNVIDPGYTRDRGVILRHLSEADKIIYRKMFQSGAIGHDVFTRRVAECMILFEESQKCMSMLVKK